VQYTLTGRGDQAASVPPQAAYPIVHEGAPRWSRAKVQPSITKPGKPSGAASHTWRTRVLANNNFRHVIGRHHASPRGVASVESQSSKVETEEAGVLLLLLSQLARGGCEILRVVGEALRLIA